MPEVEIDLDDEFHVGKTEQDSRDAAGYTRIRPEIESGKGWLIETFFVMSHHQ